MLNDGKGIRLSQLLAVTVLVGGLGWVLIHVRLDRGSGQPSVSWIAAATLALAAVLIVSAGLPIRRYLQGRATTSLNPMRAARTLALAQAGAITGSGVAGWYAAVVLAAFPDRGLSSANQLIWTALAALAAAILLVAAGLVVQRICRLDPPDEGTERAGAAGSR